jgi:hypothetical protein
MTKMTAMDYIEIMKDVYRQVSKASNAELNQTWIDLNHSKTTRMTAMKRYGWTPDKKWNHGDLRNAIREEWFYREDDL